MAPRGTRSIVCKITCRKFHTSYRVFPSLKCLFSFHVDQHERDIFLSTEFYDVFALLTSFHSVPPHHHRQHSKLLNCDFFKKLASISTSGHLPFILSGHWNVALGELRLTHNSVSGRPEFVTVSTTRRLLKLSSQYFCCSEIPLWSCLYLSSAFRRKVICLRCFHVWKHLFLLWMDERTLQVPSGDDNSNPAVLFKPWSSHRAYITYQRFSTLLKCLR